TDASVMNVSGRIDGIWTPDAISWKDLAIAAVLGRDIRKAVSPLIGQVKLPDGIRLDMRSTGNLDAMHVHGETITAWGRAGVSGTIKPQGHQVGLDVDMTGTNILLDQWTGITALGSLGLDMR